MIFNSKQMVIVVALLSAPYIQPMERTVTASINLLQAARDGVLQLVQAALAAGADKDHQDRDGSTPLLWAAVDGHKEIVELLIRAGADKDRQDRCGYAPLHWAARNGHKEVVEILLRGGANIKQPDNGGETALDWAADLGHKEIVDLIRRAVKSRALALMSGLHERPGKDSPIQLLNGFPHITEFIGRIALDCKAHDNPPQLL